MAQILEYCFYIGVLLGLFGFVWLASTVLRGRLNKAAAPIGVLLLAGAFILGPAVLTRSMAVDLGPRDKIVQTERHISLTGWDGESYAFLRDTPDAVVLQMANPDVNDSTLELLASMNQLRELDLNDSSVTDTGLATLATLPSLRTLRLRGTAVTDAGFREHLMDLSPLMQIDVRQTAISAEAITEWKGRAEGIDGATRRAFQ